MKAEKKTKEQKNVDVVFEKIKEAKINEVNLDEEVMNKNLEKVRTVRFFSTIFAGMVSGILGFTGFLGLGFYLTVYLD